MNNIVEEDYQFDEKSNLFDESEFESAIQLIMEYRVVLNKIFDNEFVIENIKTIIDKNENIDFFNKRSAKFVNKDRPTFRLSIQIENEKKLTVDDVIEEKTQVINNEIINPFVDIILDKLDKLVNSSLSDELSEIRDRILKLYPSITKENLSSFILPTTFRIFIEKDKGKLVILEYIN